MSHTWYNPGEVISDLGEISGRHDDGGRLRHVTDRPPPVLPAKNDDEMEELLRMYGGSNSVQNYDVVGPDLELISNLISQARLHDNRVPDYSEPRATAIIEPEVLVLSKLRRRLNPNVPEFRPKPAAISLGNPKVENTAISKEISGNIADGSTSASTDAENDVDKAAEALKATIMAPAANIVQSKVKRNAAIMSLMRLYATQSPVPIQEAPEPSISKVKLPTDHAVVKPEVVEKKIDEVSPQQMEESIRKVDKWFSGPVNIEAIPEVKPKTPHAIHLKPVTFKRREKSSTSGCETPRSFVSSSSTQSPASGSRQRGTGRALSTHAQELCEQFQMENEKRLIEESRDKTLWGHIEKKIFENKQAKK